MQVLRYANRVPLQFQPAACAITQSVIGNNWRAYGLSQSRGQLPPGPITVMVHMASVWVPFTSESKEAIASYPEIMKELRLGSAGRRTQAGDVSESAQTRAAGRRTARDFPALSGRGRHGGCLDQGLRRPILEKELYGRLVESRNARRRRRHAASTIGARRSKPAEEDFGENVLIVDPKMRRAGNANGQENEKGCRHRDADRQGQEDSRLDSRVWPMASSSPPIAAARRTSRFHRARCPTSGSTKSKRIIEMGSGTNRRELFNLTQAKSYMQTLLVGSGCKQLIEQGKTTSIRGLFYLLKHTIEGTREETFDTQDECDPIIEDVEVSLDAMREELHLYAKNAGAMVGPITLVDSGDEIDCSRMGSGGYSIPSIVEPEIVQFKKNTAKFVLHVEKDTVWRRFNEDKFWRKHNCILTHGGGQPPRGVRRMLHRLHHELKLPVYCLLDNDPWGYYIYSVHQAGIDQPRLRIPPHGDSRRPLSRPAQQRLRALPAHAQRADQAERSGHQTRAADRAVSVVRQQEAVAEGNRDDAEERLQARSRSPDQQGHQLRHGRVRAVAPGGRHFPGLRFGDSDRIQVRLSGS